MTSSSASFDSAPGSPYKLSRAAITAAYIQEDSAAPLEGDALTDWLATKDGVKMVSSLSREAKSIRDQIGEIEKQAAVVENPSLRDAARQRVHELRGHLYSIIARATHEKYTAQDIEAWVHHTLSRGGDFPVFDSRVIRDLVFIQKVPNAPIREAFLDRLEDGASQERIIATAQERLEELEEELGFDLKASAWSCETSKLATRATESVRTQLGMNIRRDGRNVVSCAMLIPYERAVALSRAIGMNPQEAGV